jgi:hypothetical protein
LTVAIDVEPPRHAPALNRLLPNRGVDRPSLPGNIAGEPHIQGQQARHHATPSSCGSIKMTSVSNLEIPMCWSFSASSEERIRWLLGRVVAARQVPFFGTFRVVGFPRILGIFPFARQSVRIDFDDRFRRD